MELQSSKRRQTGQHETGINGPCVMARNCFKLPVDGDLKIEVVTLTPLRTLKISSFELSVMWAQPVFPAPWLTETGESGIPDPFGKHSETFLKHNTKQNTPNQKQQRQPSPASKSQDSERRNRYFPKCILLAPLLELSRALYKSIEILFMRECKWLTV